MTMRICMNESNRAYKVTLRFEQQTLQLNYLKNVTFNKNINKLNLDKNGKFYG